MCLGADFVSHIALVVVQTLFDAKIILTGNVEAAGVRGWLGHGRAAPGAWAADVKQLPTQRPSHPVYVQIANA